MCVFSFLLCSYTRISTLIWKSINSSSKIFDIFTPRKKISQKRKIKKRCCFCLYRGSDEKQNGRQHFRRRQKEEETEATKNTLYKSATSRTGSNICSQQISRYGDKRGNCCLDQPHRSPSSGKQSLFLSLRQN